jgi:hypothetical protein
MINDFWGKLDPPVCRADEEYERILIEPISHERRTLIRETAVSPC